jgi:hypothetical protein
MVVFGAEPQVPDPLSPRRPRRSLSTEIYIPRSHSFSLPFLQPAVQRRLSEPDLSHLQSQTFPEPGLSYMRKRRVFIAKDHLDNENGSELNDEGQSPRVTKYTSEDITDPQHPKYHDSFFANYSQKSFGIHAKLISKKVLIDLGYPFREDVRLPFIQFLPSEDLTIIAG